MTRVTGECGFCLVPEWTRLPPGPWSVALAPWQVFPSGFRQQACFPGMQTVVAPSESPGSSQQVIGRVGLAPDHSWVGLKLSNRTSSGPTIGTKDYRPASGPQTGISPSGSLGRQDYSQAMAARSWSQVTGLFQGPQLDQGQRVYLQRHRQAWLPVGSWVDKNILGPWLRGAWAALQGSAVGPMSQGLLQGHGWVHVPAGLWAGLG